MANHDSALSALGERLAETDAVFSTSIVEIMTAAVQELVEAELTARIGAAPGERTETRTTNATGTDRSCCRHRPVISS